MNFSETNGSQNAYGTYLTDTVHVHGPNITFSSLATKSNAAKQTTAMDSARLTCPKMRTYSTDTTHVHGPNLTFSFFATKSKAPKQTTAMNFSAINVPINAYLLAVMSYIQQLPRAPHVICHRTHVVLMTAPSKIGIGKKPVLWLVM